MSYIDKWQKIEVLQATEQAEYAHLDRMENISKLRGLQFENIYVAAQRRILGFCCQSNFGLKHELHVTYNKVTMIPLNVKHWYI